jgi:imidazole glycerol phosphate synthase subunit HisF
MQVTGTGSPLSSPVAVTFQDTGDTVTLVAHGLENDDEVSFAAITSTTGLALNTIYYIVNKTTDTFQVASTIGGSPLPLTTDGSGTMRHRTEIVSIVANTSITMSRPMRGTGSQTLAFRTLKTGTALLKNWAVTG